MFDTKKVSSFFSLFSDKKFVALKVVKSAAHYTETALDEIKLLKCVSVIYNIKGEMCCVVWPKCTSLQKSTFVFTEYAMRDYKILNEIVYYLLNLNGVPG